MNNIIKSKKELKKENKIDLEEGDRVIDSDGETYVIGKVTKKEIRINYEDGSSYGRIEKHEFDHHGYIKVDKSEDELFEDTIKTLKDLSKDEEKIEEIDEKSLVNYDKNYVISIKKSLEEKKKRFQIMERIMQKKRHEIQTIVWEMEGKLKKVYKMLGSIELYLGVYEDVVQIAEGQKASIKTPISIRQLVLYMDEEVGNYKGNDIDFINIREFDKWLLKDNNFKIMLPEEKGVVVFRVRRHDKVYTDDGFANALMNQANSYTYLLIRNGNNLYRVWGEIIIKPHLFPKRKDFEEMMKKMNDKSSYNKEDAEEEFERYRDYVLMLQGLIDRTEIFKPLPMEINLFNLGKGGKYINFIYDAEPALTDGRLMYNDWRNKINNFIKEGSRIYFAGGLPQRDEGYSGNHSYYPERHPFYTYSSPEEGVYVVKRIEDSYHGKRIVCHFKPKDEIPNNRYWGGDYHERKNSIPFYLYIDDDKQYLNYDMINLDDCKYYLKSRINREDYLDMLPALFGIKEKRKEELVWEQGFVDNLKLRIKFDNKEKLEKIILKAIEWWKYKVKWKRPLTENDSKALRMIEKKVRKDVKN